MELALLLYKFGWTGNLLLQWRNNLTNLFRIFCPSLWFSSGKNVRYLFWVLLMRVNRRVYRTGFIQLEFRSIRPISFFGIRRRNFLWRYFPSSCGSNFTRLGFSPTNHCNRRGAELPDDLPVSCGYIGLSRAAFDSLRIFSRSVTYRWTWPISFFYQVRIQHHIMVPKNCF